MKQLTINVPDHFYATFMEYFKNIPEASLLNESSFVITERHLDILDKSSASSDETCLTREDSNNKIRRGNGL
jgi:hypothetical protein